METRLKLAQLASDIVASYVANNDVARADLPKLISDVYAMLESITDGKSMAAPDGLIAKSTSPIKKSIFPDYLICLEDGKRFKSLKRHLRTAYKLTPELYRVKWGLAVDYPMVAPNYAQTRSSLAKKSGLGNKLMKKK